LQEICELIFGRQLSLHGPIVYKLHTIREWTQVEEIPNRVPLDDTSCVICTIKSYVYSWDVDLGRYNLEIEDTDGMLFNDAVSLFLHSAIALSCINSL